MRSNRAEVKLDSIDRAILAELQVEGRLSNLELAQRVHLSPSACLRRVKALEDDGVIAQYVAMINPKAVGKHGISFTIMSAFVELQEAEFAAAEKGFTAVKHQREVGTGYFDAVTTTIEALSSTAALKGSTEDEQFFDAKH